MTSESTTPKPRTRKYGDISKDEIVAAALRIIKRDGAPALSMRSLAAELQVSTMAAYYYVANREALIELLLDKVYAGITVAGMQGTPDERIHQLLWKSRARMKEYPGLVLLGAAGYGGREILRLREEARALFKEAGYSDEYAEVGMRTVSLFHYASLMVEPSVKGNARQQSEQDFDDGLTVILAGLRALALPGAPHPHRAPGVTAPAKAKKIRANGP
ncbi:TetR/AcrR family transcriptional regulator [Azoarcus sp. DN11]|uniref:TetR/AcrR family transcriptional regulator n=1 Tax=Azoarcus sp. DN11 TaxID=356837 RepID=UPI0013E3717E|nr:TetR/AcrR family transcriptional regulator [Azoarcus sp. DN11]